MREVLGVVLVLLGLSGIIGVVAGFGWLRLAVVAVSVAAVWYGVRLIDTADWSR